MQIPEVTLEFGYCRFRTNFRMIHSCCFVGFRELGVPVKELMGDRSKKVILYRNIIKSFPAADETITFDLQQESIFLKQDCVIAFEYIPKKDPFKLPALSFRVSATGKGGFSRVASVGKWLPMRNGSGSIFVAVEQ